MRCAQAAPSSLHAMKRAASAPATALAPLVRARSSGLFLPAVEDLERVQPRLLSLFETWNERSCLLRFPACACRWPLYLSCPLLMLCRPYHIDLQLKCAGLSSSIDDILMSKLMHCAQDGSHTGMRDTPFRAAVIASPVPEPAALPSAPSLADAAALGSSPDALPAAMLSSRRRSHAADLVLPFIDGRPSGEAWAPSCCVLCVPGKLVMG